MSENPYSIYDAKNKVINEKLIAEHTIELNDQYYRHTTEYINCKLNFLDDVYKIIKNN